MNYAIDTVALVRYNANLKIGNLAQDVLEEADKGNNTIFIPVIVPMEIIYHL
ncbi:MAG: hypothetical protein ACFFD4_23755 [Candidatus Odinarchaeota archaeon]